MAVEETIQTVRESPEIEAYRIGLLKSAKELADQNYFANTASSRADGFQEAARTQAETGLRCFFTLLPLVDRHWDRRVKHWRSRISFKSRIRSCNT